MVTEAPQTEAAPLVRRPVGGDEPLSDAVFEAVEATGVNVASDDEYLYDVLDGDALDRLFTNARARAAIEFFLWGRHVVVRPTEVAVYA